MVCRNCGKEFEPSKRGRKNTGFCSEKCYSNWRRHNVYAILPKKYKRTCQHCGNEFETNSKTQKYCSVECSHEAQKGRTVYDKECLYCGEPFQTIYPKYKFCSSACASRWAAEQRRGEYFCEYCGKPRHSDHPNRNHYCSPECARKARAIKTAAKYIDEREMWERKHLRECQVCHKTFVSRTGLAAFCSEECYQIAKSLAHTEFVCAECGRVVSKPVGDKRKKYCSERCMRKAQSREYKAKRAEQMMAAFIEPVYLEAVYHNAKGICEICGLPVPNNSAPENPWGATRDHIIPLSKGGTHEQSNCQLAHRLCNSLKSDTMVDFKIDWQQKLIDEPGRWNEQLDDLWRQLGIEQDESVQKIG